MNIDRETILQFFRDDESMECLKMADRYEIAVACLSHSDLLVKVLGELIEEYELG